MGNSMYYSKSKNSFYTRDIHGVNIPDDAVEITQSKYHEMMVGQVEGKIITSDKSGNPVLKAPQSRPLFVPPVVSRFQARRALKDAGMFQQVESAISQADEFTQDAWDDAQEFRRDSDLIVSLGNSLSLDLDALFVAASKIVA